VNVSFLRSMNDRAWSAAFIGLVWPRQRASHTSFPAALVTLKDNSFMSLSV
jgi:hypothetical protein